LINCVGDFYLCKAPVRALEQTFLFLTWDVKSTERQIRCETANSLGKKVTLPSRTEQKHFSQGKRVPENSVMKKNPIADE
jgi:hypothetical protein